MENTNQDFNWETAQDGELIKFEKVGQSVLGILQACRDTNTAKGVAKVYDLKTKEGVVSFFGSADLTKKLSDKMNMIVKITYVEAQKTKGGNDFKKFDVKFALASEENLNKFGLSTLKDGNEASLEG